MRRSVVTGVALLVGIFLAAMTITFLAGRLLVPEDRWDDVLESGAGPLSAAARISSVTDEPWKAVLGTDDYETITLERLQNPVGSNQGL